MQMAQTLLLIKWLDVTTTWAKAELEERHRTGVKVIIYLILLTTLVYLNMKIYSRIDTEV